MGRSFGMRARASVVTVLAATLLVGGCSGGDEPEAEPTPILPSSSAAEPSPSESEAAEETAPEMPEEARERGDRGGQAFVRHWVDTFNFASRTGDSGALARLSGPSCGSCDNFVDEIESIYEDGGSFESTGWEIKQIGSDGQNTAEPVISAEIAIPRERYVYRNPRKVEVIDPVRITALFGLVWQEDRWLLDGIEEI